MDNGCSTKPISSNALQLNPLAQIHATYNQTHEGSFDKVFVLARFQPTSFYRIIRQQSEVPTTDYARTVLGLPFPRVLGWNARTGPKVNPVGAEYNNVNTS
ncbi:hypothetical protein C8J56DRAFT_912548 [Mycena floridula]|nr:hypothetical protein C8J56DRAFT_912548 [Mycena floridula]